MSEVDINYKNAKIAGMDASGTKTLSTEGKYCEDDIEVVYTKPTPSLQTKSVSYTPTESAQSETVTADSGYDGLAGVDVSVDAVSSTYVGSGILRLSANNVGISPTGQVNVPVGYFPGGAQKTITPGSVASASSITANDATVSVDADNNILTLSKQDVTNTSRLIQAGYVTGGTQAATDLSLSAPVTIEPAKTYNVATATRTIPAGTYLSGAQIIRGVTTTNLLAANIKKGVVVSVGDSDSSTRIKSVTGTYEPLTGNIDYTTATATANTLIFEVLAKPVMYVVYLSPSSSSTLSPTGSNYRVIFVHHLSSAENVIYVNALTSGKSTYHKASTSGNMNITYSSTNNTLTLRTLGSSTKLPGTFFSHPYTLFYAHE